MGTLAATAWASAGALPGGASLGMNEAELRASVGALERVSKPTRLVGGLAGLWSATSEIGGRRMMTTYFFAREKLERVEYTYAAEDSGAAYEDVLTWARRHWGSEMLSRGPEADYASWTDAGTDVYLQFSTNARGKLVRLVVKPRVLKEASEL